MDTTTATIYRVKFEIDEDAQFEECNGEARPLTEDEYAENSYQSCPNHPRAGSKVITFGPPQIQGCAVCGNTKYQDIPYDEYRAYYGNPDRHVYLVCLVEKACITCGHFETVESLGHIDLMDDDRSLHAITIGETLTAQAAITLPGYLGEVSREMLEEAGYVA